ncbi:MAG: hypothetical protein P8099_15160, partial [Gemmatimonadota bacterium]
IAAPEDTVRVGDGPHGLRILDFRRDGDRYVIDLEGRAGSRHRVMLRTDATVEAIEGATLEKAESGWVTLDVRFSEVVGAAGYVPARVTFHAAF